MRGSLTEIRPRYWRLRVYLGERTENGAPKQASTYFRGTKREAQSALAQFVVEVESGAQQRAAEAKRRATPTVASLLERWLEHLAGRRAPYTVQGYRRKIDRYVLPRLGSIALSRLTTADLDRAYDDWLAKGLSPTTVRQCHAILSSALHQAERWDMIANSPARRASAPRAARAQRSAPTNADVRQLLEAAIAAEGEGGVLPSAIALAALTGARRGELCALRWNDWDASAGVLTVRRSLTVLEGGRWQENPPKSRQERGVLLDERAAALLAQRHAAQQAYADEVGVALVPNAFILGRHANGAAPCLPDGLSHAFERLARDLGMLWHLHDLRHYAGSVGLAAGVGAPTVADRLGHSTPYVTLAIYGHSYDESARRLAGVMSDRLGL